MKIRLFFLILLVFSLILPFSAAADERDGDVPQGAQARRSQRPRGVVGQARGLRGRVGVVEALKVPDQQLAGGADRLGQFGRTGHGDLASESLTR